MNLNHEILVNQYGQGLAEIETLISLFEKFDINTKRIFLNDLLFLILQSKPINEDINIAIVESNLKTTYTPCVLLKKGINQHHLKKIIALPDNELKKSYVLFLNLFRIAYIRRFRQEKNNPDKWWYWDLSDNEKLKKIQFLPILFDISDAHKKH